MSELENPRIELNKYLYISPSTIQLFNSDSSDVDSIFSSKDVKKKYKIRLTSKTSGKKIDVNLAFEKKEEKVLVSAEKITTQTTAAATNAIQTAEQANQVSLTPGGNQAGSGQSSGGYTPGSGGIQPVGNTGMAPSPGAGGSGPGGFGGGGSPGGY